MLLSCICYYVKLDIKIYFVYNWFNSGLFGRALISKRVKKKERGKRGSRIDELLVIEDADIVLITIGANDIMRIVRENFNHLTYELFVNEQLRALAGKQIQQD